MNARRSAFLTVSLLPVMYPLLAFAQQTQQPPGQQQPSWGWAGPWHMWSGGWEFWWIMPLCMLFMMILCVAIFLLGHRSGNGYRHWGPCRMMDRLSGRGRSSSDPTHSSLQILNERFAKGDIQKQEYEEKKASILTGGTQGVC